LSFPETLRDDDKEEAEEKATDGVTRNGKKRSNETPLFRFYHYSKVPLLVISCCRPTDKGHPPLMKGESDMVLMMRSCLTTV
jgi:hypothetical protein